MINNVDTIEELFTIDNRYTDVMIEIDKLILAMNPNIERKLFKDRSFVGVGYNFLPYKNTCYDGVWPQISMTVQKNNVSVYIMYFPNGKPIVEEYINVFGKSNVGKSCIRIKKLDVEKLLAFQSIFSRCMDSTSIN